MRDRPKGSPDDGMGPSGGSCTVLDPLPQRTWLNTRIKKVNRRKDGALAKHLS